jgi:uncharacterized protein
MTDRPIPDPVTSPETEAFWAASALGRFLVRHCTDCDHAHWYPRSLCPLCASSATEWREGAGLGSIYTFSVMRRAGAPFVMAYVRLDEGPLMMTNIVECDPDLVRIGDRVALVFRQSIGGFAVPFFRPALAAPRPD